MLAIGIALLIGAAILALLALRAARRWLRQRAIAEVRPRAMATLAGRTVTVRGVAAPAPTGVLESGLAGSACVWHGHEVLRHYWALTTDPETGERGRERSCDSIAEYASADRFGVTGPGGARDGTPVLVDPEDAEVSGAHMCLQRVVGRPQRGVPAPADDLLARVKGRISGLFRGETIEFEYREWVIRPGDPVVVRGLLELRDGHPVIVAPPDGRLSVHQGDGADRAVSRHHPADALLLGGGTVVSACMGMLLVLG